MKNFSRKHLLSAFLSIGLVVLPVHAQHDSDRSRSDSQEEVAAMNAEPFSAEAEMSARQFTEGQEYEVEGIVMRSQADTFFVRDQQGFRMEVMLQDDTEIKEDKSNPFRGAKKYSQNDLLPGLMVKVEGWGDTSGRLMAEEVEFTQNALKVAQAVNSRVHPVEGRLHEAEDRLTQSEQNAQHVSGQMEELAEVSNLARGGARAAQQTADTAVVGVRRTNDRVTSLDEFDVTTEATVHFKVASFKLLPEARAALDELVMQAQDKDGYILEVTGHASADGNEAFNRRLSESRADAVVQYLAEKGIPLRRITVPIGFGEGHPVANNDTRQGREENRRVEVKMLVNRGLTESVELESAETQSGGADASLATPASYSPE
ncbi:MAG: OmpA family protein [Acidobacteriota bacterium]